MTTRIMPGDADTSGIANGRTYVTSTYLDVPDQDAFILTANGWTAFGTLMNGRSGPTTARPVPAVGSFLDTTLGAVVTWVPAYPLTPGNPGRWVDYQGTSV